MSWRDLDPQTAQHELRTDPTLRVLDVRMPEDYAKHRLPNSTNVPVQDLAQRLAELDMKTNWLVHCTHGRLSVYACGLLEKAGFHKIANLRGGFASWVGSGLPVEKGRPGK